MKRLFVVFLIICPYLFLQGQLKLRNKKYPSLFWEISGNGLKRPSYLFGTMHVSSKIAFHLSDSFYLGIKNANVVALETNPESWQQDLIKYDLGNNGYNAYRTGWGNLVSIPNEYLSIRTLRFGKYEKQLEQALYSNPSTINNLLYRSYSDYSSDFEEDTYLDMYIYQVGKKWGKKVAGVERYDESMKLMMEAYRDAAKDKNKKERSSDLEEGFTPDKLQEAYRTGNLDLLDSINKLNSFSDAFDEKFLYKRNEIQSGSIDSILKSGQSLFVGVGAAHLPGPRGVIEILRRKGYKLRSIMMGERDSRHKDQVEKIRVAVTFNTHKAADEFYKVDIPGNFYRFNENGNFDQEQCADMANGSYYMVTRVKTNRSLWGQSAEEVERKIDSVLYENVPGKILNRQTIVRNGYKGFDISNRTRRGDYQRYNIFITPYEILIFKMSGTGEYVKNGEESNRFFNSIQLKEYKPGGEWKKYQPENGGFMVEFPHEPFVSQNDNWQYEAEDKLSGLYFTVLRTDINNYHFAGEDTLDLHLMEESFASSEFIDKQISSKQIVCKSYPALDCKFACKDGSVIKTRFLIQGPHYYALVVHGKEEQARMETFLNSFEITPFIYGRLQEKTDTALYFTVRSPDFPEQKKEKIDITDARSMNGDEDLDETETDVLEKGGVYRNKIFSNEKTGEKIYVSFYKAPRYYFTKDSSRLENENRRSFLSDDTISIIREKKKYTLPNKMQVWEYMLSDSNSSRIIRSKTFYKDGIGFVLITEGDTLSQPSSFIKNFFESFSPADTLKGINPFIKKSNIFFADFLSRDTVVRKRALRNIDEIELDEDDLPLIKKAIASMNWNDKKYLEVKKSFIEKLGGMGNKAASDFLKYIFYTAGDTIELQYAALEGLLQQQTQYAFNVFKGIMITEPPVLDLVVGARGWTSYPPLSALRNYSVESNNTTNSSFLDELDDSLQLTRTILPDLLPLLNLNDYKWPLIRLLGKMVDSNLVTAKDYEIYFSKFLIEAKQELKKQAIKEKKKGIEKAREKNEKNSYSDSGDETGDHGNEDLSLYATLLLPYWEKNSNVSLLFQQLLHSGDDRLKYNTMVLLIRNKRVIPDTLLSYFAGIDEYRYELYNDLKDINQLQKFPASFNNHLDLAKSKLLGLKSYSKPDSLVFADKIFTEYKGKKGYIYFFRYKQKRDDANWKLATVGLVPQDPEQFEFAEKNRINNARVRLNSTEHGFDQPVDFTGYTETRFEEEDLPREQLQNLLKRLLYSKRKSAREFYDEKDDRDYDVAVPRIVNGD